MAKRQEFPLSIRRAAWKRSLGWCESPGCGVKLYREQCEYDHTTPDGLSGAATLENCRVLCAKCHREKTSTRDIPMMAKADRLRKKAEGIEPKHKRRSQLRAANQTHKRKLTGEVVERSKP